MVFEGEISEPVTEERYNELEYHTNPWLREYIRIATQIGLRSVKRAGVFQVSDRKADAICHNCKYWGSLILIDEHKKEKERETDPSVRNCDKFKIGVLWDKVCDSFNAR